VNHTDCYGESHSLHKNEAVSNQTKSIITGIQELQKLTPVVLSHFVFLCFVNLQKNLFSRDCTAPHIIFFIPPKELWKLHWTITLFFLFLYLAPSQQTSPKTRQSRNISKQHQTTANKSWPAKKVSSNQVADPSSLALCLWRLFLWLLPLDFSLVFFWLVSASVLSWPIRCLRVTATGGTFIPAATLGRSIWIRGIRNRRRSVVVFTALSFALRFARVPVLVLVIFVSVAVPVASVGLLLLWIRRWRRLR